VLLALTWLAVWHIGVLVEYIEHASVWFPAAGLTFAALLVAGYRAILPLMVSAVLVTIWTAQIYDLPLSITQLLKAGVLFGIAHIFPYYIGSKLLCWLTLSRHSHIFADRNCNFLNCHSFSASISSIVRDDAFRVYCRYLASILDWRYGRSDGVSTAIFSGFS
jgi:hypothetical protein